MALTPEFYRDEAGEHRWRLVSGNGAIVGSAGEGFASRQKAQQNLALILGSDEQGEPAVHALEAPDGLLAGRLWLPREVAALLYDTNWSDIDKLIDMTAIVFGESAGYDEAVGGPNSNGTYDYGLFQLNSIHRGSMSEEDFKRLAFDPYQAVKIARRLYVNAGYTFRPWYAYSNGSYKRHLPKSIGGVANMAADRRGLTPVPHFKYA